METSSREKRISDLAKAIAANKGAVKSIVTALNVERGPGEGEEARAGDERRSRKVD